MLWGVFDDMFPLNNQHVEDNWISPLKNDQIEEITVCLNRQSTCCVDGIEQLTNDFMPKYIVL